MRFCIDLMFGKVVTGLDWLFYPVWNVYSGENMGNTRICSGPRYVLDEGPFPLTDRIFIS